MKDYEIGIVDLAGVIRKYKIPIAAATLVFALAAAVFLFTRPRIWEVEAIFYPARISAPDEKGKIINSMVHPFQALASQLETRELDPYVSKKSGLPMERIPRFYVARISGTNQVRFHLLDTDIENSKLALTALLQILETDQNNMLEAKREEIESYRLDLDKNVSSLDARILEAEQDIAALDRERRTAQNRLNASLDEEKTLSQKIEKLKEKIDRLEKRQTALNGRSDPEAFRDALAVSNMILANSMLAGFYTESVKSEKSLRDDLRSRIAEIAEQRGLVESRIMSLRAEHADVAAARALLADTEAGAIRAHLLTPPSALSRPVNPPKATPIILAGALGFLLSFFPAVFIEIGRRSAQGRIS